MRTKSLENSVLVSAASCVPGRNDAPGRPLANRSYTNLRAAAGIAAALVACSTEVDRPTSIEPLTPLCVDPAQELPEVAFECGETQVVECTGPVGSDPLNIYVRRTRAECAAATLAVSDRGPFDVGEHEIVVRDLAGGNTEVCRATLRVVDTATPTVTSRDVELWPPNHKWHVVTPEDCVTVHDDCDGDVEVRFVWASSDEVVDGLGDGHHAPDIRNLTCDGVELRAERSGTENGRVYHLGWWAEDDEHNRVEGVCTVRVPHDRSGRLAVDDGEAHRLDGPAECQPVSAPQ